MERGVLSQAIGCGGKLMASSSVMASCTWVKTRGGDAEDVHPLAQLPQGAMASDPDEKGSRMLPSIEEKNHVRAARLYE